MFYDLTPHFGNIYFQNEVLNHSSNSKNIKRKQKIKKKKKKKKKKNETILTHWQINY